MVKKLINQKKTITTISASTQGITGTIDKIINAKPTVPLLVVIALCVIYTISLSYFSIWQFNHFSVEFDLHVFEQLIWNVIHGQFMYNDLEQMNHLGRHFSPLLLLYGPIYWLIPHGQTLLVLQSLFLSAAAIPIYLIARHLFNNSKVGLVFAFLYLINPMTIGINLWGFHGESALFPLFFGLLFYFAYVKKDILKSLILFLAAILIKENLIFVVAFFSLFLLTKRDRAHRYLGIIFFVLSLSSFFLITKVLMPHFGGNEQYAIYGRFIEFGTTPKGIVYHALTDKRDLLIQKIFSPESMGYFQQIFTPSFWLVIFGFDVMFIALPIIAQNAIDTCALTKILLSQYSDGVLAVFAITMILAVARIFHIFDIIVKEKYQKAVKNAFLGILMLVATYNMLGYLGIIKTKNKFYFNYFNESITQSIKTKYDKIPADTSVTSDWVLAAKIRSKITNKNAYNEEPNGGKLVFAQNKYILFFKPALTEKDIKIQSAKEAGYKTMEEDEYAILMIKDTPKK